MYIFLKIFLAGVLILITAVFVNMIAMYFGVSTWYSLLREAGDQGFLTALRNRGVIDLIFLFLIYPSVLGAAGYFGFWFFGKLI